MMPLYLLLAVYLMGQLGFAVTSHNFGDPFLDNLFFLWQSISEAGLLVWTALYSIGNRFVRNKVKWVMLLSGLKFAWEIISLCTGVTINNSFAVMVLFSLITILVAYFTFWQKNKANVWLSRELNI